jgi:plastocyanin
VLAAAAILAGGLVHLYLYFRFGYRSLGQANLGRSFLANGIAAIAVAAALLVRRDVIVRLAAIGLVVGTLVAFLLSRNLDKGVFMFRERGLSPSPEAALALVAELVALAVLLASFVPALQWRRQPVINLTVAGMLAAVVIAIGVGGTAVWADKGVIRSSTAADVSIQDFSFQPQTLTIEVGDSVTWANNDAATHNIQSSDHTFDSPDNIEIGASFAHEFDTAGTFTYVCGIHPQMTGTVVVTG